MAGAKIHAGGCLCGHVRFEAEGPLDWPHTCSCHMCQRHSGAPTVVWVAVAKDRIRWTGPGGAPSAWRSSDISSRAFCPVCGSTLGAIDDGPTVGLVSGAFDRPGLAGLRPVAHSHAGSRPRLWKHPGGGIA
jgi:hypothetical protein